MLDASWISTGFRGLISRRELLHSGAAGIAGLALAALRRRTNRALGDGCRNAGLAACRRGGSRDPALPARRPQPHGSARSQAGAEQARRAADAEVVHRPGEALAARQPAGHAVQVRAGRGSAASSISELLPHTARLRRRHRRRPLDVHRAQQSRAGPVDDAHRPDRVGSADDGGLGELRARLGEPQPAGVRRAAQRLDVAGRRRAQLVERLPAAAVSGSPFPAHGHAGAVSGAADARERRGAPRCAATCCARSTTTTWRRNPA